MSRTVNGFTEPLAASVLSSRSKILGEEAAVDLMELRTRRLENPVPDTGIGTPVTIGGSPLIADLDLGLSQSTVESIGGGVAKAVLKIGLISRVCCCLPMRIEEDNESERFCAASAAMCKRNNEG
jgi:hypothetical protein